METSGPKCNCGAREGEEHRLDCPADGWKNPNEKVNHPKHYAAIVMNRTGSGLAIECLDLIDALWSDNFYLGTVVRYLWRAGKKPTESELVDLKKAQFYLNRYIAKLEKK